MADVERSEASAAEAATRRWIDALNARGDAVAAHVAATFTEDARLERYGFGDNRGQVVEVFTGHAAITGWLGRLPEGVRFALEGVTVGDDELATAGYRLLAPDFENEGRWRLRLAEDGRIAWLEHRPRDITGAHPEPPGGYRPDR